MSSSLQDPGKQRRALQPGCVLAALAALLLLPTSTAADGLRGSAADRLDWPGSATDRYLDGEEVVAVLHGAAEGFAGCATKEAVGLLSEEPVWLRFGVGPKGRPVHSQVLRDGQLNALEGCILAVLTALEFGDHDGLPGEYSYPVVLQQQQGAVRNLPYPLVMESLEPLRLPLLTLPLDLSKDDQAAIVATLAPKEP